MVLQLMRGNITAIPDGSSIPVQRHHDTDSLTRFPHWQNQLRQLENCISSDAEVKRGWLITQTDIASRSGVGHERRIHSNI